MIRKDTIRSFHNVTRIWQFMRAKRLSGIDFDAHNNASFGTKRSMVLRCPSCVSVGTNMMADDVLASKGDLQHTCQRRLTVDGNFQLNMYRKGHTDNKQSLWVSSGYSPSKTELDDMLGRDPDSSEVRTNDISHPARLTVQW